MRADCRGTDIVGVGGAEGGAFLNEVDTTANLSGCVFVANQAIGGNASDSGSRSRHSGRRMELGGAIVSGYDSESRRPLCNDLGGQQPDRVEQRRRGQSRHPARSFPAERSASSRAGVGGGIANYAGGTASVTASQLLGNQAIGGAGSSIQALARASPASARWCHRQPSSATTTPLGSADFGTSAWWRPSPVALWRTTRPRPITAPAAWAAGCTAMPHVEPGVDAPRRT